MPRFKNTVTFKKCVCLTCITKASWFFSFERNQKVWVMSNQIDSRTGTLSYEKPGNLVVSEKESKTMVWKDHF